MMGKVGAGRNWAASSQLAGDACETCGGGGDGGHNEVRWPSISQVQQYLFILLEVSEKPEQNC